LRVIKKKKKVEGVGLTVVEDVREHEKRQDHREHDLIYLGQMWGSHFHE